LSGFVRSRLNYYEVLRVSPTAGGDEIDRAFGREGSVYRPHAFGGLAELCMAYETLRDPIKRRAYDASLGLEPEPSTRNRSIGAREESAADVEAPPAIVERHATDRPPMALRSKPQQWPNAPAARTLGSVKTGSLGQPNALKSGPITPPAMKPALVLGPGAELHTGLGQRISRGDTPDLSIEDLLGVEARPLDWRRAGIAVGAVIVAACVLGGFAGWWSSSAASDPPQPENAVSVSLPPVKPKLALTAPGPAAQPVRTAASVAGSDRRKPDVAAKSRTDRGAITSQPAAVEEPPQPIPEVTSLSDQAAEETPAASAVAAAMPLPNKVIARTIDRIGYACGAVSTTAPVEGEATGIFKVTCTSGQSFQASPVNGRYRFRRWERR
jgi:hypothetical protein